MIRSQLTPPIAPKNWQSSYSGGAARSFNAWDKANEFTQKLDPNDWRRKELRDVGGGNVNATGALESGMFGKLGGKGASQQQNAWQETQQYYSDPWKEYYGKLNDYNDMQTIGKQLREDQFEEDLDQQRQVGNLQNSLRSQYESMKNIDSAPQSINVTYKGASSRGYDDPLSRSYSNFA